MPIPVKLWMRFLDTVVEFRKNPCPATDSAMESEMALIGWPWSASAAHLAEYQDIIDRTRAEFEARLSPPSP